MNRNERNQARQVARLAEARRQRGDACEDCGSSDALEWDHVDPATKWKNVADLRGNSDERFWVEVAKCRLLCQPCHMAKTIANQEGRRVIVQMHGYSGYKKRRCRCATCVQANRDYVRTRSTSPGS